MSINITILVINPYFGTAEPNDNRYKGDIVKCTAKNRLDRRKIVITPGYRYNPDRYIEVLLYFKVL
jgi:hypothetical protein